MHTAAQDGTKDDPQVHDRAPACAGQSAEDGAQTCDVQQLDEENTPGLHGHVVHAVRMDYSGRLAVIDVKNLLNELAVEEETDDQDSQGNQECNQKNPSSGFPAKRKHTRFRSL